MRGGTGGTGGGQGGRHGGDTSVIATLSGPCQGVLAGCQGCQRHKNKGFLVSGVFLGSFLSRTTFNDFSGLYDLFS